MIHTEVELQELTNTYRRGRKKDLRAVRDTTSPKISPPRPLDFAGKHFFHGISQIGQAALMSFELTFELDSLRLITLFAKAPLEVLYIAGFLIVSDESFVISAR